MKVLQESKEYLAKKDFLLFQFPPKKLRFFIIIILILSIFFRFVNIQQKLYWGDETYTSLRIAGYNIPEYHREVFNGHIINSVNIQKFQRINNDKNLIDTIKGLATEEPQITPIYFIIAKFWAQVFGDSVKSIRSLSALISLLVLPAIYWLCLELFQSSTVGWIAVALVGISPVQIIYAQQARPYSLWSVMILLSSAALLRAARCKTKFSWLTYGLIILLSLYTHLLSIFVLIGQGLYLLLSKSFYTKKTLTNYLIVASIATISIIPWSGLIIFYKNQVDAMTAWTRFNMDYSILIKSWLKNICNVIISWNYELEKNFSLSEDSFTIYFYLPILILIIYSFIFICTHAKKQVWLFIFTLTGVTAFALLFPDIVFGGSRSVASRYTFPCTLGIQISLAYLLAYKIQFTTKLSAKFWQVITVVLFSVAVLSCTIMSQTQTWDGTEDFMIRVSRIINQTTRPIVVSDTKGIGEVTPLSYRLQPKVKLMLGTQSDIETIPDSFSDIFLFQISPEYLSKLIQQYKINLVYKSSSEQEFWKLEKTSNHKYKHPI